MSLSSKEKQHEAEFKARLLQKAQRKDDGIEQRAYQGDYFRRFQRARQQRIEFHDDYGKHYYDGNEFDDLLFRFFIGQSGAESLEDYVTGIVRSADQGDVKFAPNQPGPGFVATFELERRFRIEALVPETDDLVEVIHAGPGGL